MIVHPINLSMSTAVFSVPVLIGHHKICEKTEGSGNNQHLMNEIEIWRLQYTIHHQGSAPTDEI